MIALQLDANPSVELDDWLKQRGCFAAGPYTLGYYKVVGGAWTDLSTVLYDRGWHIEHEPRFTFRRTRHSLQRLVEKDPEAAAKLCACWKHRLDNLQTVLLTEDQEGSSKWEWDQFHYELNTLEPLRKFLLAALARHALGYREPVASRMSQVEGNS